MWVADVVRGTDSIEFGIHGCCVLPLIQLIKMDLQGFAHHCPTHIWVISLQICHHAQCFVLLIRISCAAMSTYHVGFVPKPSLHHRHIFTEKPKYTPQYTPQTELFCSYAGHDCLGQLSSALVHLSLFVKMKVHRKSVNENLEVKLSGDPVISHHLILW